MLFQPLILRSLRAFAMSRGKIRAPPSIEEGLKFYRKVKMFIKSDHESRTLPGCEKEARGERVEQQKSSDSSRVTLEKTGAWLSRMQLKRRVSARMKLPYQPGEPIARSSVTGFATG